MPRLQVGVWPDRKRPMLTVCDDYTNSHRILAYFISQAAADEFVSMVKQGITYQAAMEGEKDDKK